MRERRVADTDPGCSTMKTLKEYLAHRRWTARKGTDHCVDGVITECRQEARLPIVECPFGIGRIKHAVELAVRHRTDCIHCRRTESLECSHGLFAPIKRTAVTRHQDCQFGARAIGSMNE